MLSELERELKAENRHQMQELLTKWYGEKEKLNAFQNEDNKMEEEFIKMFKKYQLY